MVCSVEAGSGWENSSFGCAPGLACCLHGLSSPVQQGIFLPESAFKICFRCTLSVCAAPLFAVHTLTCVRTWKIPNFGSHAVVCTWSERCLPYHCLDTQKYITFKVLQRFKVKRVCLSDRGNENQKLNTSPQNSGASACNCVVFSLNKERERTEMNFSQKVFISNISLWYNSNSWLGIKDKGGSPVLDSLLKRASHTL